MAADSHWYCFWYSGAYEVADARASEVVEYFVVSSVVVFESCCFEGADPCGGDGVDAFALVGEDPVVVGFSRAVELL